MRVRRSLLAGILGTALVAFGVAGATGCASASHVPASDTAAGADEATTLVVRNDNFADMHVWIFSHGLQTPVGVVAANVTESFALRPWVSRAPDVTFVAIPIGGSGRADSGPVVVRAGQTVEFTIGMKLWQTFVLVR